MIKIGKLINEMINYYAGDIPRVNHLLKVYAFGKAIGNGENLDEKTQYSLDLATVIHDIGVKTSEEKYGSTAGKYQEVFGAVQSKEMLQKLGVEESITERVSFLVGHHHTYDKVDGMDYQILLEADFLVNACEDGLSADAIASSKKNLFKTSTGLQILKNLYGI